MNLSDFNFDLPDGLIARYPLKERSASRLLCLDSKTGNVSHRQFTDLIELLQPNDLLVFNNTRVIPARLFGRKETGGKIEILVERILNPRSFLAHVRASKKPQLNSKIFLNDDIILKVTERHDNLLELLVESDENILKILEEVGEIPIPPYFERAPDEMDKERYQTIYAQHDGSVAAPTAGLHFDQEMFKRLKDKNIETAYVTLHVGAGTFSPVRVEDITQHKMHSEYLEVSLETCEKIYKAKSAGGRIFAVGTTSARSLETACSTGEVKPFTGNTDIFIFPGYTFKCVDVLITNFHLPCSTLLMLVAAKAGYENVMSAYREAIEKQYRFYSYGDAMIVI